MVSVSSHGVSLLPRLSQYAPCGQGAPRPVRYDESTHLAFVYLDHAYLRSI